MQHGWAERIGAQARPPVGLTIATALFFELYLSGTTSGLNPTSHVNLTI